MFNSFIRMELVFIVGAVGLVLGLVVVCSWLAWRGFRRPEVRDYFIGS
jgi:hypothetical protein